jgi:hypothetical protein
MAAVGGDGADEGGDGNEDGDGDEEGGGEGEGGVGDGGDDAAAAPRGGDSRGAAAAAAARGGDGHSAAAARGSYGHSAAAAAAAASGSSSSSSSHVDLAFPPHKRHPLGLAKLAPQLSPPAVELLHALLAYDPEARISARDALQHAWFAEERARERVDALTEEARVAAERAQLEAQFARERAAERAKRAGGAASGAGALLGPRANGDEPHARARQRPGMNYLGGGGGYCGKGWKCTWGDASNDRHDSMLVEQLY